MICVSDLRDHTAECSNSILHCLVCGVEYSADAGDYFMYLPTYPFFCCDEPCMLSSKQVIYTQIKLEQ